jgi:Kef-type K+ transport system membrane component KefB/uncharacterized UPF0146 family protein
VFQSSILILANVSTEGARLFIDLLAILATAAVVATLFKRLKLESIPGYLVAGALIGPRALQLVRNPDNVEQISGLAIIMLMFTIGLMLETSALKRGMLSILAVGTISTLAVALGFWPIGMLLGLDAPQAVVVGLAISMSSTAVLLRIMQQRRELKQPHGQMCLGISIAQDILSVVFLAALPLLTAWHLGEAATHNVHGRDMSPAMLWGIRLVAVTCLIILGRIGLPKLLSFIARSDGAQGSTASAELVLVASAALAVGAAIILASLGFSPEMGAFLAGFMLSFTPFRHQLAGQLAPMKDLLMAIFFTAVGLRLDPSVFISNWAHVLFGVIIVIAGKSLAISVSAWMLGASGSVAVLGSIYLANAGEFSLVIFNAAAAEGLLSKDGLATAIAIVVISLVISPLLAEPAHRWAIKAGRIPLAPWIARSVMRQAHQQPAASGENAEHTAVEAASEHPNDLNDHRVIIAGYGPVGRSIAERLSKRGVPVVVIEMNPKTVTTQASMGRSIIYGDVTNAEVLETAGIRNADALVITVPDELAVMRACQVARTLAPNIFIATRTNYLSQAIRARALGADSVIVEEIVTGEAMATLVTELLEARRKD